MVNHAKESVWSILSGCICNEEDEQSAIWIQLLLVTCKLKMESLDNNAKRSCCPNYFKSVSSTLMRLPQPVISQRGVVGCTSRGMYLLNGNCSPGKAFAQLRALQ